jgi:hypothetical protein
MLASFAHQTRWILALIALVGCTGTRLRAAGGAKLVN